MAKDNIDNIHTFAEARSRLEEIVALVKDKDLSLEKSLDLYEEAIALGNRCSDLIDDTDFSAEELAVFEDGRGDAAQPEADVPAEAPAAAPEEDAAQEAVEQPESE